MYVGMYIKQYILHNDLYSYNVFGLNFHKQLSLKLCSTDALSPSRNTMGHTLRSTTMNFWMIITVKLGKDPQWIQSKCVLQYSQV